ncbi:SpoIIE family protein phosphatase [Actinomadura macrotermitis]|nr:SpoIIE family protein phosphatase [Actinomadura macrotermitis]
MASSGGTPGRDRSAAGAREEGPAPRLLGQHLLGVAPMAVAGLDGHGRISHWNRAAGELFGVPPGQAVGRAVGSLPGFAPAHRLVPDPAPPGATCGTCTVPRADGEPAEVGWWLYPVGRPGPGDDATGGVRLLALAVDLRAVREDGPVLGLGDLRLGAPADALRGLRAEPVLVPVDHGDAARLGARLGELLPLAGLPSPERLAQRILDLGHPALDLSATVRLPVVAHSGGMPRALRVRAAGTAAGPAPHDREAQAVHDLQRALLPAAPPRVAGAEVCLTYRPAAQPARAGGDWYDAIPLPGGRLAVVVGEVLGHGLAGAAIMGQLRTAVRTLARQDPPPARLLRQLDEIARDLGDEHMATCLYAVYDPVGRRCEAAAAGHVPPVLVSPFGEARVLDVPAGPPIGAGAVIPATGEDFLAGCATGFTTVEVPVDDGSRLVLCTDGLLKSRDRDAAAGLAALREQLAGEQRPLRAACAALPGALGAGTADDIALVMVDCDGIPKEDMAAWDLAAEAEMVPRARAEAAAKLAEWGLTGLTDTVQLLVSELVTNALVHGAGEIMMRLIRLDTLRCEVYDDGHELPRLCQAGATDESGRGLQLVSHLAERWGTHRTDRGKVVWFEHALENDL